MVGLWTAVYLFVAATGGMAMAEDTVRADEGNVEAIEIYPLRTTSPSTAEP